MGAYSELNYERSEGLSPWEDDDEEVTPARTVSPEPVAHQSAPAPSPEPAMPPSDEQPSVAASTTEQEDRADQAKPEGKDAEAQDEDTRRKAHEEAEAKRKAEFEAKQAEKKAAEQEQIAKVAAMSDDEVTAASMQRVSTDTEKLTRRNMKECVAEYIQTRCIEDPAFARLTMHPAKSMIHCFWYINRKAREFVEQEMKDNDIKPEGVNGVYGSDVPDDLCYQWAEDYFRDPKAKEDHEDDEEFKPKPYYGGSSRSKPTPKAKDKDKGKKKAEDKPAEKPKAAPKPKDDGGQMSLLGVA